MKLSVRRLISFTLLPLTFTGAILPHFSGFVLAQEPASFEITLTPQTEYAIAGQPFTYTLAITNVSQSPVTNIMVRAKTPQGTTLVDTYFADPNWLVGGVQRGKTGEIIWVTQQPIAPSQGMSFDFAVNVSSGLAGQQLTNDTYVVATLADNQLIASGSAVTTPVLAPTPTPSPTPPPTNTPVPIATSSAAAQPQVDSDRVQSGATALMVATPAAQASITNSTATNLAPNEVTAAPSSSINILAIIGSAGLILLLVGIIWFWKRK
jgi:uncharacterized repeat protein (TIGR01451 family)